MIFQPVISGGGPKPASISTDFYGNLDGQYITYIGEDQELVENFPLSSAGTYIHVSNPSFIYLTVNSPYQVRTSGNIKRMTGVSSDLYFVSGDCSISYQG